MTSTGPGEGRGPREGADPGGGGGSSTLRRTLLGTAAGGLLFLGLGVYLNVATGLPPVANPGPLLMLVVVGATVGGLVAPLAGGLLDRWRRRRGG